MEKATQTLDYHTMKAVAEHAAKGAVDSVIGALKDEIRNEFERFERSLGEKINTELKLHFGSMQGAEHIIQHNKLESFLKWSEDVKKSAWQNLVNVVMRWGAVIAMAAYIAYDKTKAAAPAVQAAMKVAGA